MHNTGVLHSRSTYHRLVVFQGSDVLQSADSLVRTVICRGIVISFIMPRILSTRLINLLLGINNVAQNTTYRDAQYAID
jgi:hypothetical protein